MNSQSYHRFDSFGDNSPPPLLLNNDKQMDCGEKKHYKNLDENLKMEQNFSKVMEPLLPDDWCWNAGSVRECPVIFKNENKTAILHPEASFGTSAISGIKTLKSTTIAYWEIHVPALFGSSMMFGIGRRSTKLHFVVSFDHLLGNSNNNCYKNECENFGLAHSGFLYGGKFNGHINRTARHYCDELANRPTDIGILFHGPEGWLAYFIDGKPMGYAFTNIDATVDFYYPMISSTSQRSQFTLTRQLSCEITLSLSSICLETIATQLLLCDVNDNNHVMQIYKTNLPESLIASINSIIQKKTEKMSALKHQKRKMLVEENHNSISDLINDFDVQQLTQLWQKISEIFENVTHATDHYLLPKRTRLE